MYACIETCFACADVCLFSSYKFEDTSLQCDLYSHELRHSQELIIHQNELFKLVMCVIV